VTVKQAMQGTTSRPLYLRPRVHARYVMRTTAMRTIPGAALPELPRGGLAESPKPAGIVTGRDDSTLRVAPGGPTALANMTTSRRIVGSGCWTRTSDPAVNSRLLYRLS
jgi:hypothetical protein